MPPCHTSSWQHRGAGLVGKGWGNEGDSLSRALLYQPWQQGCRGTIKAAEAQPCGAGPGTAALRLAVGLARGGTRLVGPASPQEQSCWLQRWGTCLGPAQLGPRLAGELAWQACQGGKVGPRALSGSLLAGANPCPRLLLGVTGGRWRGALAGVGGCTDPVSLASPSRVLAHRERCGCVISLCRAGRGWAAAERGQEQVCLCLPVSSCDPPQLHPWAAPASHTLFE